MLTLVSLCTLNQTAAFPASHEWLWSDAPEHGRGNTPKRLPRSHGEHRRAPVSSSLGLFLFSVKIINRESLWVCSCNRSTLAYSSPSFHPQPDPAAPVTDTRVLNDQQQTCYELLKWIFAGVATGKIKISIVLPSWRIRCEMVTGVSRQQILVCHRNPQG